LKEKFPKNRASVMLHGDKEAIQNLSGGIAAAQRGVVSF
jgi:hypothetical protein